MKLFSTATMTLSLVALASAQTNQERATSGPGIALATSEQAIPIQRSVSRQGPSENFSGSVRVEHEFRAETPGRAAGALVTFEPGARTAWHIHPLGQTLIVTAGRGRIQRWGDPIEEIRQGDVIWVPAGQKHWHGAAPDSSMAHIAISEAFDGKTVAVAKLKEFFEINLK